MTDSSTFSVGVIGAGIGGLTAAIALRRHGIDVQVYEQATELGEIGAGLTLSTNAGRILNALGMREQLASMEAPMHHVGTLHYQTAEQLNYEIRDVEKDIAQHGTAARHVHRADLHALLVSTLAALGRKVHLTHQLSGIAQDDAGVDLTFSNGDAERHHVIIACDGLKSIVRDQCFDTQPAEYTGMVAWRGLVERKKVSHINLDPHFAAVPAKDKLFARYTVRRGRLINYVAIARRPSARVESWTASADVQDVLQEFAGWHADFVDIIAATPADRCLQWALRSREPLTSWINGRVALLGDAAHPMTPFYGMGAMMAIEDAFVLGRAFAAYGHDWQMVLRRYENARLVRANTLHRMSLARGDAYLSANEKERSKRPEAGLKEQQNYDAFTVEV